MKFFAKLGDLVIRMFDIIGMLILSIPEIPEKFRNVHRDNIKDKLDSDLIKENINKLKEENKLKNIIADRSGNGYGNDLNKKEKYKRVDVSTVSNNFTPKEKERTIFILQILSGAFLVISILFIFNYLSFSIYGILGVALITYFLYLLYNKVKLMYSEDFNAYRDFFLMYVAVGIILILISNNTFLVSLFSFESLPSFSILIFAVILVMAIFVVFRIMHYRNYTFGTVVESGKKTAYVRVEYDIRSNVKPDIYLVENETGAEEGEIVKIQIEEKLLSKDGNKPVRIING